MNKVINCPICGEGHLHAHQESDILEFEGQTKSATLYFSACDTCGTETATNEDLKKNHRQMVTFKKEVDGMLSGAEVRAIRKFYSLSIEDAGKIFGGGPVAFSKYENDDLVQSQPMDAALRLAKSSKSAFLQLVKVKHPELIDRLIDKLKQGVVAQSDHSWQKIASRIRCNTVISVIPSDTYNSNIIVPIKFNEETSHVYS